MQSDADANLDAPNDLEAKGAWCRYGAELEHEFVAAHGHLLGLRINPDKAQDPTVPDLVSLADVKTVSTPMRIHPGCVTLNCKDVFRYRRLYGTLAIYFWVRWNTEYDGVWHISLQQLLDTRSAYALHWYKNRPRHVETNPDTVRLLRRMEPERLQTPEGQYYALQDHAGNATCSYVLPLQVPLVRVIAPAPMPPPEPALLPSQTPEDLAKLIWPE